MGKQWQAEWIMDPKFHGLSPINIFHKESEETDLPEHREGLKNYHMLIRKKFDISKTSEKAIINITADDYYKLYINGEFLGQGPAPSYYFNYYYNSYDVTEFLKAGENVIAVHVYYQGLINRVWNSGDYRQGMLAELFADDQLIVKTDSSWKYKKSKAYISAGVTGYDTQYLENFDSRLYDSGWRDIHFNDSDWEDVIVNIADDHKLYKQPTPPLEVYEVKPEKVKKIADGHYFIDFGEEITGQFKMNASGNKGDKIEIRSGEELIAGEEDRVRYQMRCNCTYQDFWTLSGKNKDTLEFYDYKAFRYVEVIAQEDNLIPDSFTATVRHYPFKKEVCQLNSSSDILNRVWNLCKNGVKYGSQEGFMDCPSREKGQYLGDATVTGHSHIYISGDVKLYKKAIEEFALSTFISPGMMAVAPGGLMQEIADYSMQWPMQLLNYYNHSADKNFLRKMYPIAEKVLEYYQKYQREDGLLEEVSGWNLVDWPKNLRDGYDFELSKPIGPGCHNVINAFYCGMIKSINEIRDILNIEYTDDFQELETSFLKVFYNKKEKLFIDAEGSTHSALHSNVLPLFFGLAPTEAKNTIVDLIREKRLSCGVYFSYFLMKALAKVQEYQLIFDIITSESEHSWGNMLKEGATTCFEAWGKDQKANTSLCHAWASAPIPVLIEDIIGLKPAKPGWEEISFSPQIPEGMDEFELKIQVKTGKILLEYKNEELKIKVPDGIPLNKGNTING